MDVLGDAQYDSRGFSALFCRYTWMDAATQLILLSTLTHRSTTGPTHSYSSPPLQHRHSCELLEDVSTRMEPHAFKESLETITGVLRYPVKSITTDKHSAITKIMRTEHAEIAHYLDSWHVVKNFRKRLVAVGFHLALMAYARLSHMHRS